MPVWWVKLAWSPADEYVRVSVDAEIFVDDYASLAVRLQTIILVEFNPPYPRRPEYRRSLDALRTRFNTVLVYAGHQAFGPDLHTQFFQVSRRAGCLLLGEHGEYTRTGLDQNDPRKLGINVAKVPGERETAHLADGARQFHTGGPSADDHKRQQLPASLEIADPFRSLESA